MADNKDTSDKIDPNRLIPISDAIETISFGVSAMLQTSQGIKNAFKDRIEQRKQIKKDQKIQASRLLSAKKQKDKEKSLEATPNAKLSPAKSIVNTAGSAFSRMIEGITSIFLGWLMTKLPEILEWIMKAVKVIEDIYNAVVSVVSSISNALSELLGIAESVTGAVGGQDLSKINPDDIKAEIDATEAALNKMVTDTETSLSDTKDAINKFAKDRGKKDIPIHDVDKKAHSSGQTPDPGTDMSNHDLLHENPDVKTSKEIVEKKPPLVNQNQDDSTVEKAVEKNVELPKEKVNIDLNHAKIEPVKDENKVISHHTPPPTENNIKVEKIIPQKNQVGDGVTKKKIVTPQGLGFDMDGRKIILNPDAAKGWRKVLKAAAEDGVDLTKDVTSSFRTPAQQQALIDRNKAGDSNVMTPAPVGQSPHGQGWAVDLSVGSPGWNWMVKNGAKYGWEQIRNPAKRARDPVHFDYWGGSPDAKYWIQPGRNDWMQGNKGTGEKLASINGKPKITVPIPINKIQRQVIPVTPSEPNPMEVQVASNGRDLKYYVKTINRAYT